MLPLVPVVAGCLSALLVCRPAPVSGADAGLSSSGRLSVRGVQKLRDGSVPEDPGISGRIQLDASDSSWRVRSWLEGGWDGAVTRPSRDRSLFKSYDEVYQDNTPWLECKELFLERAGEETEIRIGIQRFAWGRLDEYPANDLLNPWDYTQFLRKPLEERKIGVPSVSASVISGDWRYQAVWVPRFVPYRLPMPDERWSGISGFGGPSIEVIPSEPRLPRRTVRNGNAGLRVVHAGEIEWSVNLYHGYDPRPVFRSTSFVVAPTGGTVVIDPGYVPDFHRITSLGTDGAAVLGEWSIRAEVAYSFNRRFNVRRELWGYPALSAPGVYPLAPIEIVSDSLDYGIGTDYRPFEDGLLTIQGQQTVIIDRTDVLYERKIETILWANLKVGWLNQRIETNIALAYNPEHGAFMSKAGGSCTLSDSWKAGVTALFLDGPAQSLFGRYARNDQLEADLVYSW